MKEHQTPVIRLAIVDDQQTVREGLVALAELLDGVEVVGEATDGQQAVQLVQQTSPDVVLMDLRMPVMDGIAATRAIVEAYPDVAVLLLSTFADDALITEALRAGARGYLTKNAGRHEILTAIRSAMAGNWTLDATVSQSLVAALTAQRAPVAAAPQDGPQPDGLTKREAQVLRLVARGLSNAEIAAELFISEATVKTHLNNTYAKTGVKNRVEAVRYVVGHGLGE
ncbi:response regulator transcription factor [Micromonospora parathelypteridis]|uniref:DNA-binding NarL/FixJ family response regulator n=1 Tax=Micromonospora parathelypteridis TaxID=1839617 RepID=A0A840VQ10_9ACTN|nr:response regulator transcription factor [Micromonospora parathelypteridis]MBB5476114.1 DNA-binding NarL/FixJ family response regulator [Micromonospora parathelypteridis]GGO32762.1 DNA-binding response regulator [Micromonospora parathelypteridis]